MELKKMASSGDMAAEAGQVCKAYYRMCSNTADSILTQIYFLFNAKVRSDGGTVAQWSALSLHSKEVLGSIPGSGCFFVFPVSAQVFSRYSSFLPQSKTCKLGVGLINHS